MRLRTVVSYILWPLTVWYAVGVRVRNLLFDLGLKRQEAPHITTIGVGNLATGGTGKTPHVEYLLRLLADRHPTAVLSRGYKRRTKGFVLDDGSHSPTRLGDEPAMLAAGFPNVQVAVCENRVAGVQRLMQQERPPQVVVLDDVFQHRRIKPSLSILLTEYGRPFYADHILPYGNLREFRSACRRAGVVIVTKCPPQLSPVDRHNIVAALRLQTYQKVFFSYMEYAPLRPLYGQAPVPTLGPDVHALVLTGIAHAEPLIEHLRPLCTVHHLAYADHHRYTRRDMAHIAAAFDAIEAEHKLVITTEKDAVRLQGLEHDLPIFVQPVRVAFHADGAADFDHLVSLTVSENISFLGKLGIWATRQF